MAQSRIKKSRGEGRRGSDWWPPLGGSLHAAAHHPVRTLHSPGSAGWAAGSGAPGEKGPDCVRNPQTPHTTCRLCVLSALCSVSALIRVIARSCRLEPCSGMLWSPSPSEAPHGALMGLAAQRRDRIAREAAQRQRRVAAAPSAPAPMEPRTEAEEALFEESDEQRAVALLHDASQPHAPFQASPPHSKERQSSLSAGCEPLCVCVALRVNRLPPPIPARPTTSRRSIPPRRWRR